MLKLFIEKIEKALSRTPSTPYESKTALIDLYSSLKVKKRFVQTDNGYLNINDIYLNDFFLYERNIQDLLLRTIKRLDTCSSAKRRFRNVMQSGELPIDDMIQQKTKATMLIFQDLYWHCYGHAEFTLEQLETGVSNLWTLLNHCYKIPYLRPFSAFYVFMRYRLLGEKFFEAELPSSTSDIHNFTYDYTEIYSLFRNRPRFFTPENALKDCRLMENLIYATTSATRGFEYPSSLNDTSDFSEQLRNICCIDDPYVLISLTPYMPIPNYRKVSDYFETAEQKGYFKETSKFCKKYREIILSHQYTIHALKGVSRKEASSLKFSLSDLIAALNYALAKTCEPQNLFYSSMELPTSQPYKTALSWVCWILFPDDCTDKLTIEAMVELLQSKQIWSAVDLNLPAFFRVTRYCPQQGGLEMWDPRIELVASALSESFTMDKELIFSTFGFSNIPPQPVDNRAFKNANNICYTLFRKWNPNATSMFCQEVIPLCLKQLEADDIFFHSLEDAYIKRDSQKIKHLFIATVPANYDIYENLFKFAKQIIIKDSTEVSKLLDRLIACQEPDQSYYSYRILEQCLNSSIWDLQSRFWSFQYDIADNFYPLRSNTPRKKTDTEAQNNDSEKNEKVGKV